MSNKKRKIARTFLQSDLINHLMTFKGLYKLSEIKQFFANCTHFDSK